MPAATPRGRRCRSPSAWLSRWSCLRQKTGRIASSMKGTRCADRRPDEGRLLAGVLERRPAPVERRGWIAYPLGPFDFRVEEPFVDHRVVEIIVQPYPRHHCRVQCPTSPYIQSNALDLAVLHQERPYAFSSLGPTRGRATPLRPVSSHRDGAVILNQFRFFGNWGLQRYNTTLRPRRVV